MTEVADGRLDHDLVGLAIAAGAAGEVCGIGEEVSKRPFERCRVTSRVGMEEGRNTGRSDTVRALVPLCLGWQGDRQYSEGYQASDSEG